MRHLIPALCIALVSNFCYAQNRKDTVRTDTLKVYHSIERFAKKKKFTYQLYKAVFNLPDTAKLSRPSRKKYKPDSYERYGGRIIRNIVIQTLDPFGYNVRDTSVQPKSVIQKGGNFLHNKSSPFTVKNQLLIKKGEPLDPLELKESERLIRQADYVRDVAVKVIPVPGTDSVDVYIREQDLWSIGVGIGISASKEVVLYKDKNFAGLSHQVQAYWYHFNETRKNLVEGFYTVPYVKNTYMTATGYFTTDRDFYTNGISVNRPFYSALTKWAWGADYLFYGSVDSAGALDSPRSAYPVRHNDLDLWFARSYPLSISKSIEARSTKLITSLRFLNRTYTRQLPAEFDTSRLYFDSRLYMTGIGISNRTYYRDYYIYRYGTPEDVPAGRLVQLVGGYEDRPGTGRWYAGAMGGFGNHLPYFGYLSVFTGYGTYINKGKLEQSVLNTTVGYFSNLLELSDWRVRQFIKINHVHGFFRKNSEFVNINDDRGIRGFEAQQLNGTNKLVASFQTVIYLPYSLIGFRFAPFLFCTLGMLGDDRSPFYENRLYQGYGLGLLIKNELLTTRTFQISVGIYPYIPGINEAFFKYNPVQTYDFTFRDFDIQRPGVIAFE